MTCAIVNALIIESQKVFVCCGKYNESDAFMSRL